MKVCIFLLIVSIYSIQGVADEYCSIEPAFVCDSKSYYDIVLLQSSSRERYYKKLFHDFRENVCVFVCDDINGVQNIVINILLDRRYFTKNNRSRIGDISSYLPLGLT